MMLTCTLAPVAKLQSYPESEAPPHPRSVPTLRALAAQDIFQGRREVLIDFDGAQYRLRITRKNKLILQK